MLLYLSGDTMFDDVIYKVFKTTNYTYKKLDKGVSNQNYLLIVHDSKYIVRVPYLDNNHIFNREQEAHILPLVQDLDVPNIYFDSTTGIKITTCIDGVYEFDICPYQDKIERAATLLKKLHAKPCVDFSFHPIETMYTYANKIKEPLFDLSTYLKIIDTVKSLSTTQVLCHNDVVAGNLLFGEDRDYLIDYEYAATNDPLFDVMSFISENQITDPTLRQRFYNTYFDNYNETTLYKLNVWEAFHNILWCYWAMMMFETRQESIYQKIATDKYQALQCMDQDLFK